ncbi:MAG: Ig-like domain-containing protein [Treponema sp.]|nr:Ig-like domain-containing protein [Treponema sp.]
MKAARMIKAGVLALAMMVMGTAAFAQGANLLKNGNAGDGISGWVDPDSAWSSVSAKWNRGGRMFWPGRRKTAGTRMYQDVAVSSSTGGTAKLSAYAHGYGTDKDKAVLRLEFLGSSGSVIDSCESDYASGERDKDNWRQISVSRVVPAGAVTARVSLVGINGHNSTSDCDSYFADVVFTVSGGGQATGTTTTVNPVPASAVSLICTLEPGGSVKLAIPGETVVSWTSSDNSVATVSKKGKVKAVDEGTAIIAATTSSKTVKIQVEVEE